MDTTANNTAEKYDAHGGVSTCATGGGSYIIDKGDDNLTLSETLKITFSAFVEIAELLIYDGGHNQIAYREAINISTDRINYKTYGAIGASVLGLDGLGASNMFWFQTTGAKPQIYITGMTVNEVPLPAAGWMLLAGHTRDINLWL